MEAHSGPKKTEDMNTKLENYIYFFLLFFFYKEAGERLEGQEGGNGLGRRWEAEVVRRGVKKCYEAGRGGAGMEWLGSHRKCSLPSRRGLVQEDKRMALVYTHGLFIT
jgi:hypothetical protein